MAEPPVVTCFLRNRGDVLLVERAADAESYPGHWGAVTGYVEEETPEETARREIREETRLDAVELVRVGEPFAVVDGGEDRRWRVHPFLFDAGSRDVRPNEEIVRVEWTSPTTILRRETVPDLWRSYEAVAPSPATIAADTEHGSASISIHALEALRDAAGLAAVEGADLSPVADVAEALLAARPSMAALENRVNRAMAGADAPADVEAAATGGIDRALDADAAAAHVAADHLDGGTALTLSRSGTVVAALDEGATAAIVAESRPAGEGVGVAEALAGAGLDVTLCADAAMGHLLSTREVDAVVVGADAVLPDGRLVNKVGTRLAALAAAHEGVPCYAVAASDKVRPDDSLHLEAGDPRAIYDGDAAVAAANPTFDVTPADLIAGVLTERGRLDADSIGAVAEELRGLAGWRDRFD